MKYWLPLALVLLTSTACEKAESWPVHGVPCAGTNLLLGSACGDVLLTAGAVQLTAN